LVFVLSKILDEDWNRLHEFGGIFAPKRRFRDNFSSRFAPVMLIRLAHFFYNKRLRNTAKAISLVNCIVFGLEVPARLKIGPGLVIPHTNGTIIGAGYIGSNVTIFQQVTIGARLADFEYDIAQRPHIDDDVTITAGAKILGPIKLGVGCTIGANAVVLTDVPEGALAAGVPAKIKLRKGQS
jgi:serine O-acetyltransferase